MKILSFLVLALIPFQALAVWETVPPLRNTYSTSSVQGVGFSAPYATPSDICMIGNPTSGLITVHHIRIWGIQSTAGVVGFYLMKRSTFTGCQNTALTAISHDLYQPSSYADIQWCTAAPTLGTYVGTVRGVDIIIPQSSSTTSGFYDWDFGPSSGTQPIMLHKNDMLSVNFDKQAIPAGMKLGCEFTWQEQ